MANDNTLLFETRVNLSGLQGGMDAAERVVVTDSQKMASAMSILKGETAALGQAYQQLGTMAAEGNAAAIAAIAEHIDATNAAKAAVAALAEAEEEEVAVQRTSISTRMQASAELRILEGSTQGATRAIAALASTVPGLTEAIGTLFTAFAAVAILELFVNIAEKIHNIAIQFDVVAQAEKRASDGFNSSIAAMEAAVDAQSAAMRDQLENTQGHVAALKYDLGHLQLNLESNDKTVIQQAQDRVDALKSRIKAGTSTIATGTTAGPNGEAVVGSQTNVTKDAQAAAIDLAQAQRDLATANIQLDTDNRRLQTSTIQLGEAEQEEADKAAAAANKAAAAKLKALESALTQEELVNGKSAQLEESYWSQYVNTFTRGSSQYDTVADKILSAKGRVAEEYGKDVLKQVEDDQRASESAQRVSDAINEAYAKITEQENRTQKSQEEFNAAVAKSEEITAQNTASIELATIAQDKAMGSMTALGAAHATAAVHAQEYTDKLAALRAQLAAVQAETPNTQEDVDSQSKRALGLQNQIQQTQGQAQVSGITDTTSQAQALSAPYLKAFDDINQGFLGVTNKMILGTQSISRDFAQMGAQLVVSVADSVEKMLAQWVRYEIQSTLAHQTANTAKIASDSTAAATTTAISTQTSLMQISHEAAVAAAKAWSSLSGIPIIGPVLGAAAAAGTYAGVMALAAFETGGIIPNTGVALVHQGEAVLPAGLTSLLLNASSNSTSNNSNINATTNINGGISSDRQFKTMLSRNSEHVANTVSRGLRRQGRA